MLSILRRTTLIGKARYLLFDRYYNRFVPLMMVLMCLAATLVSAALWFAVFEQGLSPVLALVPAIAVGGLSFAVILYTNMERFAILILLVTMYLNDGISTGTDTKITFSLTLLGVWVGLWLFKLVIVERRLAVRPSPANIPALVFIGVVIVSLVWSGEFSEHNIAFMYQDKVAVRVMTTAVIIISILTYFLYANNIKSIGSMRIITWVFILTGGVFGVLQLIYNYVDEPFNVKGQFSAWVGAFALGQALFNTNLPKWQRLGCVAVTGMWVFNNVFRYPGLSWLSGWLPLSVCCMVLLFLYSKRLFFIVFLIGITLYVANEVALQSVAEAENAESGQTRLDAWGKVIDLTLKHPLLGTGPAGYYFYFTVNIGGFFQLSHNNYMDIFAQTGFIGFGVWLALWAGMGLMTWRMYLTIPKNNGFEHALSSTLVATYVATVVTMMLGDWVTPFPYTQTLFGFDYTIWAWILAGMTTAFYHIYRDTHPEIISPAPTLRPLVVPILRRPAQKSLNSIN